MPFSAARPAWSGLVIDPKFTRNPAAKLAAMPMACAVRPASSFEQSSGACSAGKRPCRRGAVEPAAVVIGIDRLGDLALDFEAGQECLEERRSAGLLLLCDRKRRCERRDGWVRQKSVCAIGRRRQLSVVEIHGMSRRAVRKRRIRRGRASIRSGPRIDAPPSSFETDRT